MKRYVTWKEKKINDNLYIHPNTNGRVEEETWWKTIFIETDYKHSDGRFMSVVEYPNTTTPEEVEAFRLLDPAFEFTFITEAEANTFLASLWEVSVSNFEFTDNRPRDIF